MGSKTEVRRVGGGGGGGEAVEGSLEARKEARRRDCRCEVAWKGMRPRCMWWSGGGIACCLVVERCNLWWEP